jgi:hypothetical protein
MNLDSTPKALGFVCSPSEHTMYARGHGRSRLVLGVYVDDLIMAGADTEETARFKKEMMEQFCMSDLGLMHYYLGIEVRQSGIGIVVMRRSCWSAQAWRPATLQQCPWSRGSSSARIASTHPRTPKFYRSMVRCLRYSCKWAGNGCPPSFHSWPYWSNANSLSIRKYTLAERAAVCPLPSHQRSADQLASSL